MPEVTKRFVAAKAIIKNTDNKILLLREAPYDEGTNVGKWGVPGGRLEIHESLVDGLRREVKEESGLEISLTKLVDVFENFQMIRGEMAHIVRLYYLCEARTVDVVLSEDHDDYRWISLSELKNFEIMPGEEEIFSRI